MQQRLDTALLEPQPTATLRAVEIEPHTDHDDGLLRTAVPIMIAAYGTAFGIATFTFWRSGQTLLSLAICIVYMTVFFGVPIVMSKIRNRHDVRWAPARADAQSDQVSVFTGRLGRTEALLQIVTVPLVVTFGFAAFAVIWISVGP